MAAKQFSLRCVVPRCLESLWSQQGKPWVPGNPRAWGEESSGVTVKTGLCGLEVTEWRQTLAVGGQRGVRPKAGVTLSPDFAEH